MNLSSKTRGGCHNVRVISISLFCRSYLLSQTYHSRVSQCFVLGQLHLHFLIDVNDFCHWQKSLMCYFFYPDGSTFSLHSASESRFLICMPILSQRVEVENSAYRCSAAAESILQVYFHNFFYHQNVTDFSKIGNG